MRTLCFLQEANVNSYVTYDDNIKCEMFYTAFAGFFQLLLGHVVEELK